MPKNAQTTALISHASKVMLKILQARLQQYMKYELPDVQFGFRKGLTLTSIHDHWKNHSLDQMDLCWQSNVSAFEYAI